MDAADDPTMPRLADDPIARAAFEQAVERAVRGYLADVMGEPKTELLTNQQWADLFDVHRGTMARMLKKISGAQRLGGHWRMPLSEAPPRYLIDRGFYPDAATYFGESCR